MKIIAFTGLAGSGKTTAQNALMTHINTMMGPRRTGPFTLIEPSALSFAGLLRDVCEKAFPYVPSSAFRGTKEQKEAQISGMPDGVTGRKILQHIGTEGFRALDPEIWVRALETRIVSIPDQRADILFLGIIDDVRFPNEAKMVRKYGKLYRIQRPHGEGAAGAPHASEQFVDSLDVDGEIINDGDLKTFKTRVLALLDTL